MKIKNLLAVTFLLFVISGTYAQEDDFQTIFGGKELRISGFGGPMMDFSTFDGQFAHFMGGGGGLLLNDFFIGGYGMGKTNTINTISGYRLEMGFGGLWTGYTFFSKRAIHPVIHLQTGWGDLHTTREIGGEAIEKDVFFVLQPVVELEMNFTSFFKLGIGGSYRLVSGVEMLGYTDAELSSPGGFISLKFGWFE